MTDNPTILAFDTSGPYCAAAVLKAGTLTTRVEDMARGQGERLMLLLDEILTETGTQWSDLDAIGVGTGPGNFTGIRISVSAARGLALGLGVSAIGVSLFDTTMRLSKWSQVYVPAPRDQKYWMDFDRQIEPSLMAADFVRPSGCSADYDTSQHISEMVQVTAQRLAEGARYPRPAPLYVKQPDAAPSREKPPVILP